MLHPQVVDVEIWQDDLPLPVENRGEELLAPPQPTQGLATLEAMGVLAQFDMSYNFV